MAGAVWTPTERAIIYGAIFGGLDLEQVNELLAAGKHRPLTASSFRSIQEDYVPVFRQDPAVMGQCIYKPLSWSGLKNLPRWEDGDV